MTLFGMPLDEKIKLAKRFREAREFLGLSVEEAAKMCDIDVSEVKHLEEFSQLQLDTESLWRYQIGT